MIDTTDVRPVALVTGGAIRLGKAIALGLARDGHDLIVHYRSSEGPALETQEEIRALGSECTLVQADLAEPQAPKKIRAAIDDAHGRLDVLVNAAANFHSTSILDVDADEWDQVLDVNLRAPHLLVRACAELLKAAQGCVVNIADHMGMRPWVRYGHHSVSKAGLIHLTKIQARALAPDVRVNAIAPGLVLPPDGMSVESFQREIDATLVKRCGTPDDVVGAVRYLIGAGFVSGQLLVVDGGGTLLDGSGAEE